MLFNWKRFSAGAVIVLLLLMIPVIMEKTNVLNLLFLIFLFIILSQSWNILGGYVGQVNLGYAAFFGIGAMMTRLLWFAGLPFLLAFFCGGLGALIFALIIGFPAFRLKGAYFVIGTLAVAEILRIIAGNAFPSISSLPATYIASYSLIPRYYLSLVLAAVTVATVYLLSTSKAGLAMVAVREDENTAESAGISVVKYKLWAFVISTFIAGLGGGTFAFFHVSYYPSHPFSPHWTFDALFIAYIGGIGTVVGPIIGTLFYIGLRELFPLILPQEIHTITFGVLFILVILWMPKGLIEVPRQTRRIFIRIQRLKLQRSDSKIESNSQQKSVRPIK